MQTQWRRANEWMRRGVRRRKDGSGLYVSMLRVAVRLEGCQAAGMSGWRDVRLEGQIRRKFYFILHFYCVLCILLSMRFPRVKAEGQSYYHCISRIVEGRFIFGSSAGSCFEAEKFLAPMRSLEAFSGVRVLTYALMANHFHLLCEVPEPRLLSQNEVLERIEAGYGPP